MFSWNHYYHIPMIGLLCPFFGLKWPIVLCGFGLTLLLLLCLVCLHTTITGNPFDKLMGSTNQCPLSSVRRPPKLETYNKLPIYISINTWIYETLTYMYSVIPCITMWIFWVYFVNRYFAQCNFWGIFLHASQGLNLV